MYANEKQNWDDMKQPGDWMHVVTKSEDGVETPYGITMICKCGDAISLSHKVHQINTNGPLDISPSIGHYNNNNQGFKCHYFIKNGEYVQA